MIPNLYCQAYFTRDKDPVWTAYVPNRAQYPLVGLYVPVEHPHGT